MRFCKHFPMRTGFPYLESVLIRFIASTLVFASVEEQWDHNVISCDGHVTKAANNSNGVVQAVFCFHVAVVLAQILTILP